MMKYLVSLIGLAMLTTGCTQTQKLQQKEAGPGDAPVAHNVRPAAPDAYASAPQVVRYDRYLLVSTDPSVAQQAPLEQMIDIRIPASLTPTVADAMRYALKQSGYSLCAVTASNAVLYQQALPAVHYQLGPMRLNTALQILAGNAWQLEVDDVQRIVCHTLRSGYRLPEPAPASSFLLPNANPAGKAL